jgi:hypothetical protein
MSVSLEFLVSIDWLENNLGYNLSAKILISAVCADDVYHEC